jgi:hypothetical protein
LNRLIKTNARDEDLKKDGGHWEREVIKIGYKTWTDKNRVTEQRTGWRRLNSQERPEGQTHFPVSVIKITHNSIYHIFTPLSHGYHSDIT